MKVRLILLIVPLLLLASLGVLFVRHQQAVLPGEPFQLLPVSRPEGQTPVWEEEEDEEEKEAGLDPRLAEVLQEVALVDRTSPPADTNLMTTLPASALIARAGDPSDCIACHGRVPEGPGHGSEPPDTRFAAGEEDDPEARGRWFWEQRAYPQASIPADVHKAAMVAELNNRPVAAAETLTAAWTNLGPAPLKNITYAGTSYQDASGRALAIAIHPTNPNLILLGTAQGGIWKSTDGGTTFRSVGESVIPSLAIKVIRFAPSNPNIVYAGTGEPHSSTSIYGMGVLKSTDGGETWQALPRTGAGWDFEYAAISGLQVDPRDANVLYVTTAAIATVPSHFNPPHAPQTGIFKSTNGGQSWTLLKAATQRQSPFSSSNVGFMDLEIGGPNNPNLLYATEYAGGIYKSVNGGTSWSLITPLKAGGGADFPATVTNFTFYYNGKFYLLNRFRLRDDFSEFDRIEIGVSPHNPNVVYAGYSVLLLLDANGDGQFNSQQDIVTTGGLVFKTTNGGQSWSWLSDWGRGGAPNYCDTQCAYDNTVEVNPNNENDVVIGGSANYNMLWPDPIGNPSRFLLLPWRGMVFRSLNGGQSWVDTTPHCTAISDTPGGTEQNLPYYACTSVDTARVIHPDIHGAAYAPNGRIYVATDGGLHRATVSGSGSNSLDYRWDNLNAGLSTLQFYFFDAHPTNPNIILGGLQDNSCAYYNGSFWDGWCFGDGTLGAFDPVNPNYVYMGSQTAVHRHDNGGAKVALTPSGQPANNWHLQIFSSQVTQQFQEQVPFLPVFEIDPVQTNIVYGTGNGSDTNGQPLGGLYQSSNRGDSWSRVGSYKMEGWPTSISVSPVNHNLVWVGTNRGKVYLYDFGNNQIYPRSTGLPNRYVSKVEASPSNADTVYVTFSGYNANTPSTPGKVFKSTNRGQSWINISGNLPDVPVSALALDPNNPNQMWVGCDVGVFITTNGGATWSSYRLNMPVVAIMDLKYNARTGYLMAATHGRGMWRIAPGSVSIRSLYLPLVMRNFDSSAVPPTTTPTPTTEMTATPTPGAATPTATATPTTPPAGRIYGQVRYRNSGISGIPLSLMLCIGSSCITQQTTTSGSGGNYAFVNPPTLPSGYYYFVYFANSSNANYLAYWRSFNINSYTAGSSVAGGNFDIANVALQSPAHGASAYVPTLFTWASRGVTNDHFSWAIANSSGYQLCYVNPPEATTSFILTEEDGAICGLYYYTPYRWYVYVTNGATWNNGYGLSYYYRNITFVAGLQQGGPFRGGPIAPPGITPGQREDFVGAIPQPEP